MEYSRDYILGIIRADEKYVEDIEEREDEIIDDVLDRVNKWVTDDIVDLVSDTMYDYTPDEEEEEETEEMFVAGLWHRIHGTGPYRGYRVGGMV